MQLLLVVEGISVNHNPSLIAALYLDAPGSQLSYSPEPDDFVDHYCNMDTENRKTSLDVAAHQLPLTPQAEIAAKQLHKHEAEVSQYVRGAVEVRSLVCYKFLCPARLTMSSH